MYRAFKTKASLFNGFSINPKALVTSGDLKNKIQKFFLEPDENGVLDASKIWDTWFPELKADVFISHSSRDASNAKKFASWLYQQFGVTSFIDSEVWGFADDLLQKIDDHYCWQPKSKTYSYKGRNATTANVHMILTYALTRMIDQTECVFFLESNNSVPIKNDEIDKTFSPWIFHELATIELIDIKKPIRLRKKTASFSVESSSLTEEAIAAKFAYPKFDRRLIPMGVSDLNEWAECGSKKKDALDWLYENRGSLKVITG